MKNVSRITVIFGVWLFGFIVCAAVWIVKAVLVHRVTMESAGSAEAWGALDSMWSWFAGMLVCLVLMHITKLFIKEG